MLERYEEQKILYYLTNALSNTKFVRNNFDSICSWLFSKSQNALFKVGLNINNSVSAYAFSSNSSILPSYETIFVACALLKSVLQCANSCNIAKYTSAILLYLCVK